MQVPSSEGVLGSGNKLYLFLVTLLVLFIVLGGGTIFYITVQSGYDKQYLAIAVEQQLVSQRLAMYSLEAASGKGNAFKQLKHLRDTFEQLMTKLKNGDAATGLPAAPQALKNEVDQVALLYLMDVSRLSLSIRQPIL
jgi:twitching motility protein PilJ